MTCIFHVISSTRNFTINGEGKVVLDLFIENTGRINYGTDNEFKGQKKGLHDDNTTVYKLDGEDISSIEIISLEFKSKWVKRLPIFKCRMVLVQADFTDVLKILVHLV